jgi:hypothetical protein
MGLPSPPYSCLPSPPNTSMPSPPSGTDRIFSHHPSFSILLARKYFNPSRARIAGIHFNPSIPFSPQNAEFSLAVMCGELLGSLLITKVEDSI